MAFTENRPSKERFEEGRPGCAGKAFAFPRCTHKVIVYVCAC